MYIYKNIYVIQGEEEEERLRERERERDSDGSGVHSSLTSLFQQERVGGSYNPSQYLLFAVLCFRYLFRAGSKMKMEKKGGEDKRGRSSFV
jgi:hypothetical protein